MRRQSRDHSLQPAHSRLPATAARHSFRARGRSRCCSAHRSPHSAVCFHQPIVKSLAGGMDRIPRKGGRHGYSPHLAHRWRRRRTVDRRRVATPSASTRATAAAGVGQSKCRTGDRFRPRLLAGARRRRWPDRSGAVGRRGGTVAVQDAPPQPLHGANVLMLDVDTQAVRVAGMATVDPRYPRLTDPAEAAIGSSKVAAFVGVR